MFNQFPQKIRLVEVGARDGLQNEKSIVSAENKLKYIQKLVDSGHTHIEATSFVRADRIPQMADADEVFIQLKKRGLLEQAEFPCLVPNLKGMEKALEVGCREVAFFTATSETFNKKNINASIQESFERLKPVADLAKSSGIRIRAYISTVFGCPYEGKTSIETLQKVVQKLKEMGAYEISLGDTIGVADPNQVQNTLKILKKNFDPQFLALHFHDTYGLALSNILASLDEGMTIFDASSGGLGGCPYAKGASGNVATEDVVYLMNRLGIETGLDLEKLYQASSFILNCVGKTSPSKVYQVMNQNQGAFPGSVHESSGS